MNAVRIVQYGLLAGYPLKTLDSKIGQRHSQDAVGSGLVASKRSQNPCDLNVYVVVLGLLKIQATKIEIR